MERERRESSAVVALRHVVGRERERNERLAEVRMKVGHGGGGLAL